MKQATPYVREDDRFLYAGNDRVELVFQKNDGRLYSLIDKASRLDFLAKKEAYWGPFHFWMTVAGKEENIFGALAIRFTYETVPGKDGLTLTLTWEQFRVSRPAPLNVRVRITIDIPSVGGLTHWRIAVANGENLVLQRVDFPSLHGVPQLSLDGRNDYLAFPSMSGVLFQDPLNNFLFDRGWGAGLYYPSGYFTMQFLAYYSTQSRSGLYMATSDPNGDNKFFHFSKRARDWGSVEVLHFLPLLSRTDFLPNYGTVLGVFVGDWYDAAQIYRTWAVDQSWALNASLRRGDGAPEWYRELSLHRWVHSYTDCQNVNPYSNLPVLSQETADLAGASTAMDWAGWERFAWYIDYPKVFPPKEGWPSFEATIAQTQERGNPVSVLPNVNSFSSRLPEWEEAKAWALVGEHGEYQHIIPYSECGLTTELVTMCPATKFWQDQLRALLLPLISRRIDVVWLDGFPATPPRPCFGRGHDHAPGGGNWFPRTYATIFERIKAEARQLNPQIVFSSEGMAETYLGLLDSVSDPWTTGWSPTELRSVCSDPTRAQLIPLWHAVYHDFTLIQSGLSLLRRVPGAAAAEAGGERDYYIRGLGRALVWGEVPSIACDRALPDLNAPEEESMKQYVKRIAQARRTYGVSFLAHGRMLRPPEVRVPEFLLPGAADIPYSRAAYPPSMSPTVLGSLWRAQTGEVAYFFTNISHDRVTFDVAIDPIEVGLSLLGPYEVYQVRNGDYSLLHSSVALPLTQSVSLAPLDVLMIGLSVSSGDAEVARVVPNGIVNAASYRGGSMAPGEIFVAFGHGMGPRDLVGWRLNPAGRVDNQLAETRVLFDGVPAPLIYSRQDQVSGVVPYSVAAKTSTQVQVEYRGARSKPVTMWVAGTSPGIFVLDSFGRGPGAILNEDGTVNTKSNPARRGSLIALYATGEGQTVPEGVDGQLASGTPPRPRAQVRVRIDGIESEVAYAGGGPHAVAGLFQVNVRVPPGAGTGDLIPVVLSVGGVNSQGGVTMAIR